MRLKDVKWEPTNREPFASLRYWAVDPMKVMANILVDEMDEILYDSENPEKTELASFAANGLRNYIEDLEETLHRFDDNYKGFDDKKCVEA